MTDANTASRPLLESKHVRPGAKARIAAFHPEVIAEVRTAVTTKSARTPDVM